MYNSFSSLSKLCTIYADTHYEPVLIVDMRLPMMFPTKPVVLICCYVFPPLHSHTSIFVMCVSGERISFSLARERGTETALWCSPFTNCSVITAGNYLDDSSLYFAALQYQSRPQINSHVLSDNKWKCDNKRKHGCSIFSTLPPDRDNI